MVETVLTANLNTGLPPSTQRNSGPAFCYKSQKQYNGYNHKRTAVEAKSPIPPDDITEEPYYKIPTRHVPQVLSEMAVCDVWLVCLTRKKTLVTISFNGELRH